MLRLSSVALLFLVVLSAGLSVHLPASVHASPHSTLQGSRVPFQFPVQPATPSPLYTFRDDFNYSTIDQMVQAGWTKCGSPNAPSTFYEVSNNALGLYNDGNNGAAACWTRVPKGITDWTVSTKGAGVRVGLVAFAGGHNYWIDASALQPLQLYIDSDLVLEAGYFPWDERWHDFGIQVRNGVVSMFYEDLVIGTYTSQNQNTTLTGMDLVAEWNRGDSFDQASINQIDTNAPDYTVDALPSSQTIYYGQNTTFKITLTSQNNFAGRVNLTTSISPPVWPAPPYVSTPDLTLTPSTVTITAGGQSSSILTATTKNMVRNGTYQVRINTTNGQIIHIIAVTLSVNHPATGQDFTITPEKPFITMHQRGDDGTWPSQNDTITLTSIGGFTGTIALDDWISDFPLGTTFTPKTIFLQPNMSANATLTIARDCWCDNGRGTYQIQANTGGLYHYTSLGVEFVTAYFTLSVSSDFSVATPNHPARMTVTVESHNNFNGTVDLYAGLVTSYEDKAVPSFSPRQVRPPPNGTITATMIIADRTTTVEDDFWVTITGSAGWTSATASTRVRTLDVDYSPGVAPGTTATYTMAITGQNSSTYTLTTTITSVNNANVTYQLEMRQGNAVLNTTSLWINVETGDQPTPLPPLFLIARDLASGNAVYAGNPPWGNGFFRIIPLQAQDTIGLAGYPRRVNVLGAPATSGITFKITWDAETGILGTYDEAFPYNGTQARLELELVSTNAWAPPSLPAGLSANLYVSTNNGPAPLSIQFTGEATGGQAPYTYQWSFGDGFTDTSPSPYHAYTHPGSYTVTLTITDRNGNTQTRWTTITATPPSTTSSRTSRTVLSQLTSNPDIMITGIIVYMGIAVLVSLAIAVRETRRRNQPIRFPTQP